MTSITGPVLVGTVCSDGIHCITPLLFHSIRGISGGGGGGRTFAATIIIIIEPPLFFFAGRLLALQCVQHEVSRRSGRRRGGIEQGAQIVQFQFGPPRVQIHGRRRGIRRRRGL